MLERLQVDLDIIEGVDEKIDLQLSDKVNEAYTMLFAIANFVSPLLGAFMYTNLNMDRTCDIVGFVNIGLGVICLIFNCGLSPFSENRAFTEKLENLRKQSPLFQDELEKRKLSGADVSELTATVALQGKSILMRKTAHKKVHMGNQDVTQQKLADELSYRKAQMTEYNRSAYKGNKSGYSASKSGYGKSQ